MSLLTRPISKLTPKRYLLNLLGFRLTTTSLSSMLAEASMALDNPSKQRRKTTESMPSEAKHQVSHEFHMWQGVYLSGIGPDVEVSIVNGSRVQNNLTQRHHRWIKKVDRILN